MNRQAHIVLCTNADSEVGMGHAVRCAGLLNQVTTKHRLTVLGGDSILTTFFPFSKYINVTDWVNIDLAEMELNKVDLVLVDIPIYKARNWAAFRYPDSILVAIDDHGGSVAADIIFNGTVMPDYHHYKKINPSSLYYIGPKYALIRPEFKNTKWRGEGSNALCILIGSGADARNWVMELVRGGSRQFLPLKVNLIVNNAFESRLELENLCEKGDIQLHVGLDAENIAKLFSISAVALVTAGTGLYEAIASGVPVVAFPQISDLSSQAEWFSSRGACIDLTINGCKVSDAVSAINLLSKDQCLVNIMRRSQEECFDGGGMVRVAKILDNILEKLK